MNIPAFPTRGSMGEVTHEGMTLLDHFAGLAMQALIAGDPAYEIEAKMHIEYAYEIAEAMLAERAKRIAARQEGGE